MELVKLKAENDRLSVRIARLEAQVVYADKVLSQALAEAFGACRKALPTVPRNPSRQPLSA
jgi:hypothetical protein